MRKRSSMPVLEKHNYQGQKTATAAISLNPGITYFGELSFLAYPDANDNYFRQLAGLNSH